MNTPSNDTQGWDDLRNRIIGLGERSARKSYFPELQRRIEELEKTEQALADSEQNFRCVFNSTHDAILIHDVEGHILEVNAAAESMFGFTRNEATSMTIVDCSAPQPDVEHRLHSIWSRVREGHDQMFEWKTVRRPHAQTFDAEVFLRRIQWSGQECILGVVRDISTRKLLEEQLISAQRLDGLGTLAGGIAHDFNNLLMIVLTSAEMMKRGIGSDPQLMKQLDRIITASQRGSSITKQLLLFSHQEQMEMQHISPALVVKELLDILDHFLPKDITIHTDIDIGNGIILGNAGHLQQAILNLAINARDAMPGGGTLTVKLERASPADVTKRFPEAASVSYAAISITDTGTGMNAETIKKIYDPFFTTKERGKGTGLGLSIVHSIVTSHNGYVHLTSVEGEGTTFTLYFPLASPLPEPVGSVSTAEGSRSETILVVEDEEVLLELLTEHLTSLGYTVLTASGGAEALDIFSEKRKEIQLLITDLGMPGMSGQALVEKIRKLSTTLPIVISSGYLEYRTPDELKKIGATAVITKPYRVGEIETVVSSIFTDGNAPA